MLKSALSNQTYPLHVCGNDPRMTDCQVDASELEKAPFNYQNGDVIFDKVTIAARNVIGLGPFSDFASQPESFAELISAPSKIMLEHKEATSDTAVIMWKGRIVDSTTYKLYTRLENFSSFTFEQLIRSNEFTIKGLETNRQYQFKVESENQCGKRHSNIIQVTTVALPEEMSPI